MALVAPVARYLINAALLGFQLVQSELLFFIIACFAKILAATICALSKFVFLAFTLLTCENIRSTLNDEECGKEFKFVMKLDSSANLGLTWPSLTERNSYQYRGTTGTLSLEVGNSLAVSRMKAPPLIIKFIIHLSWWY